jgi:hypothetical protein
MGFFDWFSKKKEPEPELYTQEEDWLLDMVRGYAAEKKLAVEEKFEEGMRFIRVGRGHSLFHKQRDIAVEITFFMLQGKHQAYVRVAEGKLPFVDETTKILRFSDESRKQEKAYKYIKEGIDNFLSTTI